MPNVKNWDCEFDQEYVWGFMAKPFLPFSETLAMDVHWGKVPETLWWYVHHMGGITAWSSEGVLLPWPILIYD